ncbi:glycoside hydrolase family protein [Micromonospora sp. CPCC 205371]|nr:glycoside hydrolase family protein [Micromonospora sp. CPCC 205371]
MAVPRRWRGPLAASLAAIALAGWVVRPTGADAAAEPYKGVANSACADLTRLTVSWYYNWMLSPGSCSAPGFVPMIAGKSEKTPEAVSRALNQVANAGYRTVLGFNEPNKTDQANLTVAQVVALWPHLTARAEVRVGSPSTSADTAGQAWFRDFLTRADTAGLRVDFLTVHWYGWNAGSCDAKAAAFESYLRWVESLPGNRPIWITEFGCLHNSKPDAATVQAFHAGALAMLARHPRVERHAWYPWIANNGLVDSSGALTPLGTQFAAAPAYR